MGKALTGQGCGLLKKEANACFILTEYGQNQAIIVANVSTIQPKC
jgi:hypothetical protein